MPQPTRSDVHISTPLTNVALAWWQDNPGVAGQVFPMVPVTKKTDLYWQWDLGDLLRRTAKKRAPGTESAGTGFTLTTAAYSTEKTSLHQDLPWDIIEEADESLDLENGTTRSLIHHVQMQQEFDWADTFFKAGVWGIDKDGAGADFTQWNLASSTPIINVRAFMREVQKKTGFHINTITVGAEVWDTLIDHPAMVDRIKATGQGSSPAVITEAMVAEILGIPRVFVADMVNATSNEGATLTTDHIVDAKGTLLTYSPAAPSRIEPSAGYTFARKGRTVPNGFGVSVNRFDIDKNEATRIEAQADWDQKLVASDLGLFMENVLS